MPKKCNKFFLVTAFIVAGLLFSGKAFADVTKIVFTTDPQSISSGQVSGPISIQLQDDSGAVQKAGETIYLNLSSSGSGEFSSNNSTWKPLPTLSSDFSTSSIYISTNSSNRTFYYKGLASGKYAITVSAKSRSGAVFNSISQDIGIDVNLPSESTTTDLVATTTDNTGDSQDDTSTPTDSTDQGTQIITKTVTKYISVHSSPEDLSPYEENSSFNIYAGRERLAYVGTPIKFVAKYKNARGSDCIDSNFNWSFGDGTKGFGINTEHVYKFAGDYNVVLNGSCGVKDSVSRTAVKVLKPYITMIFLPSGDLEFNNLGKTEINLGDWKVNGNSGSFEIPTDTIVDAGKQIIIPREYSRIDFGLNGISLFDPSGSLISTIGQTNSTSSVVQEAVAVTETPITVAPVNNIFSNLDITKEQANNFVEAYKKILALLSNPKEKASTNSVTDNTMQNETSTEHTSLAKPTRVANLDNTASTSVAASSTGGFWSKLFGLPIKGLKAVAGVFYEVK